MIPKMNILVTNDDGWESKGIRVLANIMRQFGRVAVIAPKRPQSGRSTAVSIGARPVAYKRVTPEGEDLVAYLDGTPASCVKFAIDEVFPSGTLDFVVSGVNHGYNVATATNYSGTMGAAEEAALNGIPAVGVSLGSMDPDADFSAVELFFPEIFAGLAKMARKGSGVSYNVNFPDIEAGSIKGVRVGHQGFGHWENQFEPWDSSKGEAHREEGETLYIMKGNFVDDTSASDTRADHHIVEKGYISITAQTIDRTSYDEVARVSSLDKDF